MGQRRQTTVTLTVLQWQILRAFLRRPEEFVSGDELGFSHTETVFEAVCHLHAWQLLVCREGVEPTEGNPLDQEYAMTAAGIEAAEYGKFKAEVPKLNGEEIAYIAIQPDEPAAPETEEIPA